MFSDEAQMARKQQRSGRVIKEGCIRCLSKGDEVDSLKDVSHPCGLVGELRTFLPVTVRSFVFKRSPSLWGRGASDVRTRVSVLGD